MIKWFKQKQQSNADMQDRAPLNETETVNEEAPFLEPDKSKHSIFARIKQGLSKTRHQLGDGLSSLLLGKKELDQNLVADLETLLISADFGIETTEEVLKRVTESLARKKLGDEQFVYEALKSELKEMLESNSKPLSLEASGDSPFVLLMVGVNGAGKTTTIGKLAKQFQQQGKKVMLAAGDTFRAAAIEQLQLWGERNGIPVIAQQTGADSASVIYDAMQSAAARKIDVLIADTAGRLHTQAHLIEELKKIKRVLQKLDPNAPHETMLVLDAGIGQNALVQARQFHEAVHLTGITMTKLDGTAKGGILFAIANELKIPFRYIGVGEGIADLQPFDATQFVGAVFNDPV